MINEMIINFLKVDSESIKFTQLYPFKVESNPLDPLNYILYVTFTNLNNC